MAEVLSQSEVDALLAAVGTAPGQPKPKAAPASDEPVEYYDFTRPDLLSSQELRALVDVHELAARSISAALSAATRASIQCRHQTFDQVAWGEFIVGLPNPTCFAVAEFKVHSGDRLSASGPVAFELSYAALYPIIDRLLGGSGTLESPTERTLTDIEQHVASRIVEIILEAILEIWCRATKVEASVTHLDSNPQGVPIASPTEMAALATFEITAGRDATGMSHLCLPLTTFGPLVRSIAAAGLAGGARIDAAGVEHVARALNRIPVRVEAIVEAPAMRLRDIAAFASGTVIDTGALVDDELVAYVAGKAKFRAAGGEFRGRRAIRTLGPVESSTGS